CRGAGGGRDPSCPDHDRLRQHRWRDRGRAPRRFSLPHQALQDGGDDLLERISQTNAPVLVFGESGTGKELVAQALHYGSPRTRAPFVAVNCATLSETLLESELFGHARGAFTGAVEAKKGLFLEADGGTLFLDEIGELPLTLQAKLLRVLETSLVRPVGG